MSNIIPGCECIIINSPNHNGKQVTAVRKMKVTESVRNHHELRQCWIIKGKSLAPAPDWATGQVCEESQLRRIDNYQPDESEIKRKELVK